MIERDLSRNRRFRLYYEAPVWAVVPEHRWETCVVSRVRPRQPSDVRTLVIEALVPYGASFGYGLLGFTSTESFGRESVRIASSTTEGPLYLDSLASKIDTVRWGLPFEYLAPRQRRLPGCEFKT